jgi:hypothetical protein
MWVRSQDKETFMDFSGFKLFQGKEQIRLQCRISVNDSLNTAIVGKSDSLYCLGIYETKERALEILDDIMIIIRDTIPDYPDSIYIMSKE